MFLFQLATKIKLKHSIYLVVGEHSLLWPELEYL